MIIATALLTACTPDPRPADPGDPSPPPTPPPTSTPPTSTPPTSSTPTSAMPLLPAGDHLTMMVTFEPLPAALQATADAHWDLAKQAGMQTARIQLDWRDLDLGPGLFDEAPLREALEDMQAQGLAPYVGIYTIDSEGPVVPLDLTDEDSPTGLVGGRSMDDPELVARYQATLDWAVPMIVSHGGYVLSIANEPEGYIEDNPAENAPVLAFYEAALTHARTLDEELALSLTMTSSVLWEEPPFHDEVVGLVDVVSYNYYCLAIEGPQFVVRHPVDQTVPADLDALVTAAAGKEVILHELGCPAGWDDSVLGSDDETQRLFFETAFAGIAARPEIRVGVVFQMVDWSERLFDQFYRPALEAEGVPAVFTDSFEEWLTTSGFLTFDGDERPSWDTFLDATETQSP